MVFLKEKGVATGIYYPIPLHRHSAFREYVLKRQTMKNSEWLSERVLSLPMSPYMTSKQVEYVCNALFEALGSMQDDRSHAKL
jgi:dTDP-4-amino-4,6-dideoxygalactose transaminase